MMLKPCYNFFRWNMKKKIFIGLIIAVVLISITVISTIVFLNNNLKALSGMTPGDIDLSSIEDGEYTGSYSCFPVSAEVKVTVSNHQITDIEILKHVNGQGAPAEAITDYIIDAQSLDVEIVTGATYSSKVIIKAVENALIQDN